MGVLVVLHPHLADRCPHMVIVETNRVRHRANQCLRTTMHSSNNSSHHLRHNSNNSHHHRNNRHLNISCRQMALKACRLANSIHHRLHLPNNNNNNCLLVVIVVVLLNNNVLVVLHQRNNNNSHRAAHHRLIVVVTNSMATTLGILHKGNRTLNRDIQEVWDILLHHKDIHLVQVVLKLITTVECRQLLLLVGHHHRLHLVAILMPVASIKVLHLEDIPHQVNNLPNRHHKCTDHHLRPQAKRLALPVIRRNPVLAHRHLDPWVTVTVVQVPVLTATVKHLSEVNRQLLATTLVNQDNMHNNKDHHNNISNSHPAEAVDILHHPANNLPLQVLGHHSRSNRATHRHQ